MASPVFLVLQPTATRSRARRARRCWWIGCANRAAELRPSKHSPSVGAACPVGTACLLFVSDRSVLALLARSYAGTGVEKAFAGIPAAFSVQTRDEFGVPVSSLFPTKLSSRCLSLPHCGCICGVRAAFSWRKQAASCRSRCTRRCPSPRFVEFNPTTRAHFPCCSLSCLCASRRSRRCSGTFRRVSSPPRVIASCSSPIHQLSACSQVLDVVHFAGKSYKAQQTQMLALASLDNNYVFFIGGSVQLSQLSLHPLLLA